MIFLPDTAHSRCLAAQTASTPSGGACSALYGKAVVRFLLIATLVQALSITGLLSAEESSSIHSASATLWSTESQRPTAADLAAYDICILPAAASMPQASARPSGQIRLARIQPFLAYTQALVAKAGAADLPVIAGASGQSIPKLDTESPKWQDFAIHEIAEPALTKGFDGWVVDGADNHLSTFVKALHAAHPSHWVFVQNPSDVPAGEATKVGCCLEGPATELVRHDDEIRQLTARDVPVLVVAVGDDQVDPATTASHFTELKAIVTVTTPGAVRVALAPLKERPRHILILFGWNPKEAEKPQMLPIDTMTGELFQTPIEWLGYEAEYLDVARSPLPAQMAARYAAVLVDAELQIPGERELATAEWLAKAKDAGVPVLFTGSLPFGSDDALSVLQDSFGLRGTLAAMPHSKDASITFSDPEFMRSEAKLAPRVNEFRDLQAPDNARVLMSLTAKDEASKPVRYQPVFLAPWGGMWLEPYVILRASQDSYLFYADPYKILAAVLSKHGAIPAPDTTTRDGRRLFYSHIDGDGFAGLTDFRNHPFCGEVVRDRVLKEFPIPVTVSVVESDITAVAEGVEDAWQPKLAETARSIFALPNVQVASHSFSHPYQWDPDDPNPGIYTEANMPLKPVANYPKIDVRREIIGSIDYINKELAPKNKPVELMLWSGNCRPGETALRMVRELGIENMNGGNTIISRLYPGIAGIAPRVMQWGGELQINAANQNEFMYANGWNGPFYGGYADVIDTFERTEAPRRVKPVNVYYHFYSATCLSSLRALEKIHHWCLDQPLHPVTARQFAQITKDAWQSHVFDLGPNHWLLASSGDIRTFRLPADLGRPDMDKCKGVTGWTEHQGSIYIHTNGSLRTEILLMPTKAEPLAPADTHLRLATSDAEIEFMSLTAWTAAFKVQGLCPCTVEFAGLPAKAVCNIIVNSAPSQIAADERGHLTLPLPADAQVTLDANRSRYALLR